MFDNSKCKEDLSKWKIPASAIGIHKDPFGYDAMFDSVTTMPTEYLPKIVNMRSKDPIEEMFKRSLNRFCEETGSTTPLKNFEINKGFKMFSCDIIYANGTTGTFVYRFSTKLFEVTSRFFSKGWISSKTVDDLIEKVNNIKK